MTMRAAWAAAFEPRTAAGTATTAIIGPAAAAIFTTTAIVAATVVAIAPTAAVRPLETSPRIAADTRGIAREILARLGSAGARCACFAGQKNGIVFCDYRLGRGFGSGGLDAFAASLFVDFWLADGSRMQRTFVRCICFRFAEGMGVKSACLDILDLFCTYIVRLGFCLGSMNLLMFFSLGFFFFLLLFSFLVLFRLFEGGAAHERVGCGVRLCFFVLGFDQAGGDYRNIFLAKRCIGARRFLLDRARGAG